MMGGCLCCTMQGDLLATLRDVPWRFSRDGTCWFDRVIIETTDLADPAPILHTLMTDERCRRSITSTFWVRSGSSPMIRVNRSNSIRSAPAPEMGCRQL